jgi:hypothetical protein
VDLGDDVLAGLPRLEGLVGLYLVDLATAQLLATLAVGDTGGTGGTADRAPSGVEDAEPGASPSLLSAITECVHRLGAAALTGQDGDDVEDLVLTTGRHHHVVRLLPRYAGSDALLLLSVRRDRANLGLARHLLLRCEVALVA